MKWRKSEHIGQFFFFNCVCVRVRICRVCACMPCHIYEGQMTTFRGGSLLSFWSQGSNSGPPAWWQALLATESRHPDFRCCGDGLSLSDWLVVVLNRSSASEMSKLPGTAFHTVPKLGRRTILQKTTLSFHSRRHLEVRAFTLHNPCGL